MTQTVVKAPALAAGLTQPLPGAAEPAIAILSAGKTPATRGAAECFAGDVFIDQLFQGTAPARITGGLVSFAPGARTAWHVHPLGQTLYVVNGVGRVQRVGEAVLEMRAGDLVWIPAGVRHWHGAAPDTGMSHLALTEQLDGKVVTWLEQVSEDQYRRTVDGKK